MLLMFSSLCASDMKCLLTFFRVFPSLSAAPWFPSPLTSELLPGCDWRREACSRQECCAQVEREGDTRHTDTRCSTAARSHRRARRTPGALPLALCAFDRAFLLHRGHIGLVWTEREIWRGRGASWSCTCGHRSVYRAGLSTSEVTWPEGTARHFSVLEKIYCL